MSSRKQCSTIAGCSGPRRRRLPVRGCPSSAVGVEVSAKSGRQVSQNGKEKTVIRGGGVGGEANPPGAHRVERCQGCEPCCWLQLHSTLDTTAPDAHGKGALKPLSWGQGDPGQAHEGGKDRLVGVCHLLLCGLGIRRSQKVVETAPIGTRAQEVVAYLRIGELADEIEDAVQAFRGEVPCGLCLGSAPRFVDRDAQNSDALTFGP